MQVSILIILRCKTLKLMYLDYDTDAVDNTDNNNDNNFV